MSLLDDPESARKLTEAVKLMRAHPEYSTPEALRSLIDAAVAKVSFERGLVEMPPPKPPEPILPLITWSREHRIIDDQPFVIPPFLEALYQDTAPDIVVKKAAQVMVSEWAINTAMWVCDTRQGGRGNVLYLYPNKVKLEEFSHARVDKAINESPYLMGLMSGINNVGLKRMGKGYLYLRGADRRASVLTVDADCVVYDELDEMQPWVLPAGEKRLGSSLLGWQRKISTPTYQGIGIDAEWDRSDQRWYMIPCDHCGYRQPLVFDNLRDDLEYECEHCHWPMSRHTPGEWVPLKPEGNRHGYYISKLYSPRANLRLMVDASQSTNETERQEFYNSDLGLAYAPKGTSLNASDIDACIDAEWDPEDTSYMVPEGRAYMGVDVGTVNHVVILLYPPGAERPYLLMADTLEQWHDLDPLMNRYHIHRAAVDAGPEIREPKAFVERFQGRAARVTYKQDGEPSFDEEADGLIAIPRTEAMDEMYSMILDRRIIMPVSARWMGGRAASSDRWGPLYKHLMAPHRVLKQNSRGNTIAVYDEAGKPDHFAHALCYAIIASHDENFEQRWASMGFVTLSTGLEETRREVVARLRKDMVAS